MTLAAIGVAGIADPVLGVPGLDGWQEWLIVMLNFLFVNAVMALSSAILLRRLDRALVDEQALSNSLVERNDELERSEQIRLAFLRATSHELRTPLSAIVGFAETLRDRADRLADTQREQLLERMAVNADRLGSLITDLFDVDRLSNGLVTASRRPHDLAVLVRIDDEGTGFDPRYRDAIFEPFVQGPDRHDDPKPGTGLGRSLARELIRLHDGDVRADNLQPSGARVEITLPVQSLEPALA